MLTTLFVGLSSCGGGSKGTGGHRFEGSVRTTTGIPVSNATVSVQITGDTALTDVGGNFVVETALISGDIQLTVESEGAQYSTTLSDIPAEPSIINVTLEVDPDANQINPSDITIRDKDDSSNNDSNNESSDDSSDDDVMDDDDQSESDDDSTSGSSDSDDDDDNSSSSSSSDDESEDDESEDDDSSSSSSSGDDDDSSSSSSSGDDDDDSSSSSSSGADDDDESSDEGEIIRSEGPIQAIDSSSITVQGNTYQVTASTEIKDEEGDPIPLSSFSVGDSVRVEGTEIGGELVADEIEAR